MNNNAGGTNIPMQTVSIPTKETKTRNSSELRSAKCVQCILPLLCILQLLNVVMVSFCFYQYGTLERDFETLRVDLQEYKNQVEQNSAKLNEVERLRNDLDQDIKNFRDEMDVKISNQEDIMRDVKRLASNLTLAKKTMYDYETPSYDDANYDEDVGSEPSHAPPSIVSETDKDNYPPSRHILGPRIFSFPKGVTKLLTSESENGTETNTPATASNGDNEYEDVTNTTWTAITDDTPTAATASNGDNEYEDVTNTTWTAITDDTPEGITNTLEDITNPVNLSDKLERHTRNIYNYQKDKGPYEEIDLEKNEAEDYRTTENWNRPRKVSKVEIEEKVKMEKDFDILQSAPKQNSFISDVYNSVEPSNLTKTRTEDSLAQRKETVLAMKQTILPLETGPITTTDNLDRSTPETVAIHLVGDTSKIRLSKEKHYDANHRMYHPKGHIKDWKVDTRTTMDKKSNYDQYFKLENGHLKVKEGGLYFVYVQIFYSTKEDTSGFNVYVNENVVMRCITTGVSTDQISGLHSTAPNSCYTAGIVRIQPEDNLNVKEMQGERFTVFEPTRSFFGLFKL